MDMVMLLMTAWGKWFVVMDSLSSGAYRLFL
jgi:hypothetical protein